MRSLLVDQPPWYVLGPAIGLVLVGLLVTLNVRMGVVGGWSDLLTGRLGWKAWFVIGIVGGGLLFRLLAGASTTGDGRGTAGVLLGDREVLVGLVLAGAGVLVGFGAKTAGGCTSGNGLSGASFGSRGSMVAMATFMGTAIAAALALETLA